MKNFNRSIRGSFCIVILVFLTIAPMAHAGQWVVEHYVVTGEVVSKNVQLYSFPDADRYGGDIYRQRFGAKNQVVSNVGSLHIDGASILANWSRGSLPPSPDVTQVNGKVPALEARVNMTAYAELKWNRNQIRQIGHSSGEYQMVNDPEDDPPKFLYVLETARVGGKKYNYSQTPEAVNWRGDYFSLEAQNNFGDSLGEGVPDLSNGSKSWVYGSPSKKQIRQLTVTGDNMKGPGASFHAKITLDPGYENDSRIGAEVRFLYDLEPINLTFTPDPNGLPVMACPPNSKPLNQYLITDNIPCIIGYGGTNSSVLDQLSASAYWKITAPPLLPLYPPAPKGMGNSQVFYQHEEKRLGASDEYTLTENVAGMRFVMPTESSYGHPYDKLPNSNAYFGPRTITHHILNTDIPAPIALFYPSTSTNHPDGGPPGWNHWNGIDGYHTSSISTPNWIYYYSQAFPTPYGFTINYRNTAGSGSSPGENHVHIGENAHGNQSVELFAMSAGSQILKEVGFAKTKGIYSYARTVTIVRAKI